MQNEYKTSSVNIENSKGKKPGLHQLARINASRSLSLMTRVRSAQFPVYGLVDEPLGLKVLGSYQSGQPDQPPTCLGFTFLDKPETPERMELQVHSSLPKLPPESHEQHEFSAHSVQNRWIFEIYHLAHEFPRYGEAYTIWQGELLLADEPFTGHIHSWTQPRSLVTFSFKGTHTYLGGHAYNLPFGQLLTLLRQLVPINEREDVLLAYQEQRRTLASQLGLPPPSGE